MPRLDTVFFDLDNTLCEYRRSMDAVLDAALDSIGVDPFFDAQDWVAVMEAGVGNTADTQHEFYQLTFTELAERNGRDHRLGLALADAYSDERDYSNVRFRPGAEEALDALDGRYRLGVITNGGSSVQREKLDALGIRDRFETVICPGDGILPKPENDPFERATADLGVAPEAAIHVGDSLDADVAGANAAGLHSAWVPYGEAEPASEAGHEPTHTLSELSDLPRVIEG